MHNRPLPFHEDRGEASAHDWVAGSDLTGTNQLVSTTQSSQNGVYEASNSPDTLVDPSLTLCCYETLLSMTMKHSFIRRASQLSTSMMVGAMYAPLKDD